MRAPLPALLLLREPIRSLVPGARRKREGLAYVIHIETHMASVLYDFPALTLPTSSSVLLVILRDQKKVRKFFLAITGEFFSAREVTWRARVVGGCCHC